MVVTTGAPSRMTGCHHGQSQGPAGRRPEAPEATCHGVPEPGTSSDGQA